MYQIKYCQCPFKWFADGLNLAKIKFIYTFTAKIRMSPPYQGTIGPLLNGTGIEKNCN